MRFFKALEGPALLGKAIAAATELNLSNVPRSSFCFERKVYQRHKQRG